MKVFLIAFAIALCTLGGIDSAKAAPAPALTGEQISELISLANTVNTDLNNLANQIQPGHGGLLPSYQYTVALIAGDVQNLSNALDSDVGGSALALQADILTHQYISLASMLKNTSDHAAVNAQLSTMANSYISLISHLSLISNAKAITELSTIFTNDSYVLSNLTIYN